MATTFTPGMRVRIPNPEYGKKRGESMTHYGKIVEQVEDMFDHSPLYLVNVGGVERTYKEESFILSKKQRTNKE